MHASAFKVSILCFILLISALPSLGQEATNVAASSKSQDSKIDPSRLTGRVTDESGALIVGATVSLFAAAPPSAAPREATTGSNGDFVFTNIANGVYKLSIDAPGFTNSRLQVNIDETDEKDLGEVVLAVASTSTQVNVTPNDHELAAEQLRVEEKQRLFGVLPNYLVTYERNPAPLSPKQKFTLIFKYTVDPAVFVLIGTIAGIEQSANGYAGYGQGAQGYAKRYGATYADYLIGNTLSSAVLPTLFKQDPRYVVKGVGSTKSRIIYAIERSVVRRSDNGRLQPDYSSILGNLASGGISNLYYPSSSQTGASLTFQNAGIGVGIGAAANVVQEFLFRKLTLNVSRNHSSISSH